MLIIHELQVYLSVLLRKNVLSIFKKLYITFEKMYKYTYINFVLQYNL